MKDNELTREWVAKLRSGEYKQCYFRLRQEDSFCCLGVLCDIVDPNGWILLTRFKFEVVVDKFEVVVDERNGGEAERKGFKFNEVVEERMPPTEISNFIGLDREIVSSLADLNDLGHPFEVIADKIDELCGRI